MIDTALCSEPLTTCNTDTGMCDKHTYPPGCQCYVDSDCYGDNTVCSDLFICHKKTSINVDSIEGYIDFFSNEEYTTTEIENEYPYLEDYEDCEYPADFLPLPDGTALVSCYGSHEDDDGDDPVLRIQFDGDGLAREQSIVVNTASFLECDKPARMALQGGDTPRFVFISCFGHRQLLVYDIEEGEVVDEHTINGYPIDVIASSNYVYVSGSTSNAVNRFPIPATITPQDD